MRSQDLARGAAWRLDRPRKPRLPIGSHPEDEGGARQRGGRPPDAPLRVEALHRRPASKQHAKAPRRPVHELAPAVGKGAAGRAASSNWAANETGVAGGARAGPRAVAATGTAVTPGRPSGSSTTTTSSRSRIRTVATAPPHGAYDRPAAPAWPTRPSAGTAPGSTTSFLELHLPLRGGGSILEACGAFSSPPTRR